MSVDQSQWSKPYNNTDSNFTLQYPNNYWLVASYLSSDNNANVIIEVRKININTSYRVCCDYTSGTSNSCIIAIGY